MLGVGTWRVRRREACSPSVAAILQTGRCCPPSRVRAKGGSSPSWSRAGYLFGSILLVGTWQKNPIQIETLFLG